MMREKTTIHLTTLFTCACAIIWASGCPKSESKPKRADHEAAHKTRYHPDINPEPNRHPSNTNSATTPSDKLTRPKDLTLNPAGETCPVVFINGETITIAEVLEPIIEELKDKAETMQRPLYLNYLSNKVEATIRHLISTLLIYQEARTIYASEQILDAIDKEADRWIKEEINKRFGGVHARYEEHLKSFGLSVDNMKERAKRQVMVRQFQIDRLEKMLVQPNRRERMKFYQANQDKFTTPAKAEMFLIEIPIASELDKSLEYASAEEIAKARQRARDIIEQTYAELQKNVDFCEVAKKYSRGVRAHQGGAWGEVSPGALTGRWAKALEVLFQLQSQQMSEIIETEESFFIVKCGKMTPEYTLSFEEAQEKIISQILDEQFLQMQNDYIRQLIARATISKYPEFFRSVVAAAPHP